MTKMSTPCEAVKMQKSHSTMLAMVGSPTIKTKNPSTHAMPRIGTNTKEACTSVLYWEGGRVRDEAYKRDSILTIKGSCLEKLS